MQPKTAKRRSAFRRANRSMPRRRIDIATEAIDYKNPDLLKKFVTESGKILPRRVTGMPAHMHRKITREEAGVFIDAYFREYAGVDAFITKTLEDAQKNGRVETILGRRRPINGIKNTTGRIRNPAERFAVNTVIQGSAADLIKRAMLAVDQRLGAAGMEARMVLQIHDELVFEAPDDELAGLGELVRREMIGALDLSVPLKVDLFAGPNWLDVEPLPET